MADLGETFYFERWLSDTESDVSERLFRLLDRGFHIQREVKGVHFSGKKVRVDCVIVPKISDGWANKEIAFGVEIKRGNGNVGELTKHISQSVDYANSVFEGFGYLNILCFPDCTDRHFGETKGFYSRLLGQLGIGFIAELSDGIEIRHTGHLIYSDSLGVIDGKHWKLIRKFGSK